MALNIKNERVCRLAKQAAELTGRSQVSVLEEALEAYLAEAERDQVRARRMQAAEEFIKDITGTVSEQERAERRRAMQDLYDENGLPR